MRRMRGAASFPNSATMPVLSKPGQSLLATDAGGALFKSSNGGPFLPFAMGAAVAAAVSTEQASDFSTSAVAPTYATLFTLTLSTLLPVSFLKYSFTGSWSHNGGFGGNISANFRFRLNGSLLVGGCTDNKTQSQIGTVARTGRSSVTAGAQTLVVEVARLRPTGSAIGILVATDPDLYHAALILEEQPA